MVAGVSRSLGTKYVNTRASTQSKHAYSNQQEGKCWRDQSLLPSAYHILDKALVGQLNPSFLG